MKSCGIVYSAAFLALILSFKPLAANAQPIAPKDNKAFTASKTTTVDLGPEIDGMAGRQLRLRMLTIEPGGHIGLHSHKDRPAVVYVVQGTDTIMLEDGTTKALHAGDTSSATKNTTHWHRNDGNEAVILIAVDVFHQAK